MTLRPQAALMAVSQSPSGKDLLQPFLPPGPGGGTGLLQSTLEPTSFSLDSLKTEPGAKLTKMLLGDRSRLAGEEYTSWPIFHPNRPGSLSANGLHELRNEFCCL